MSRQQERVLVKIVAFGRRFDSRASGVGPNGENASATEPPNCCKNFEQFCFHFLSFLLPLFNHLRHSPCAKSPFTLLCFVLCHLRNVIRSSSFFSSSFCSCSSLASPPLSPCVCAGSLGNKCIKDQASQCGRSQYLVWSVGAFGLLLLTGPLSTGPFRLASFH